MRRAASRDQLRDGSPPPAFKPEPPKVCGREAQDGKEEDTGALEPLGTQGYTMRRCVITMCCVSWSLRPLKNQGRIRDRPKSHSKENL